MGGCRGGAKFSDLLCYLMVGQRYTQSLSSSPSKTFLLRVPDTMEWQEVEAWGDLPKRVRFFLQTQPRPDQPLTHQCVSVCAHSSCRSTHAAPGPAQGSLGTFSSLDASWTSGCLQRCGPQCRLCPSLWPPASHTQCPRNLVVTESVFTHR